ncbi:MAG: ammonium transporter [Solirubrobacterales bacterium]|nr:ammonium transporter [Solirubrobacterales bacterium]
MPPGIDTGDTAWMLIATALVMLMTPALGLFYAGFVRSKNTLNTFMMSLAALGIVTVSWAAIGYSFAFDEGNGFIGGFGHAFLHGVGFAPRDGQTIPHLLFFAFQGTFCIVTSALVSGAVVERMRFRAFLAFLALWSVLVYPVLAHWVFGGGWLQDGGTLDFAGGVPVEMASGFSALAAALVVGHRKDYGRQALLPHNAMFILLGAGLLWFGWFGFNGGSGLSTGNPSILAFVNTLLAPACTMVVWFVLDAVRDRKVTAVGAATAVVVGCVGITPAAGYVSPGWAMLLGALAALPSYAVIVWRPRTRLDETLDVLAAHGLAGLFGILFIGFFAQKSWNGVSDGLLYGNASQLADQALAILVTPAYAFAATFAILKGLGLVMRLRVHDREESTGLDVSEHGEEAYATGEGALLLSVEDGARPPVPVAQP